MTHPVDLGHVGLVVHPEFAQIILVGHVLWIDGVLLQHVPLPVILPGEGFRALPRIVASGLGAVEFAGFRVLVIDVPFQMRDRAEASPAPFVLACARPFMIASVVVELMKRVLDDAAGADVRGPGGSPTRGPTRRSAG